MCRHFLQRQGVAQAEITAEELLSEIWLKLLGNLSVDASTPLIGDPEQWSGDPNPECDERVKWLFNQIGGSEAIRHRREDILRQRHGRAATGIGRPMVQPRDDGETPDIPWEPDEPSPLDEADYLQVWRGLVATANLEFRPADDVSMLLRMLSENPDTLQTTSGGRWPVSEMIILLNIQFSPPLWTDDRVDNAKRRLLNWIKRLKRDNGLDATDLEALFARVARQQKEYERPSIVSATHLRPI